MASRGPYRITPYTAPPSLASTALNPDYFSRQDESTDTDFYSTPRFVTHIDDNAIAALSTYYGSVLPTSTSSDVAPPPRILDLCSSWISHYPPTLADAARERKVQIYGLGMNAPELERNKLLDSGGRILRDLNSHPDVDAQTLRIAASPEEGGISENEKLDATTCTVSIDYLTQPARVLSTVRRLTKKGGTVHLAISNRCFPTKAVRRWLYAGEERRLEMCAEDLWRAGWRNVEIVEVTDGSPVDDGLETGGSRGKGDVQGFMAMLGLGGGNGDPLWVVRGQNTDGIDKKGGETSKV